MLEPIYKLVLFEIKQFFVPVIKSNHLNWVMLSSAKPATFFHKTCMCVNIGIKCHIFNTPDWSDKKNKFAKNKLQGSGFNSLLNTQEYGSNTWVG